MSGAVSPNIPHSSPVCMMFNDIAQYLKIFGVTMMTSSSKF